MKFVVVAGFLIVLADLFAGQRGLPALLQSRRDAIRITQEIAALRSRNAALTAEARGLREDPAAIELVARQTLGLARAGEIVVTTARCSDDR